MDAMEGEGTMTTALCPRCGEEIRIELSAPGRGKSPRTAGLFAQVVGRILGGGTARYETEAAPITAQPHAGLNAGEKAFRPMDVLHDVQAPWRFAMRAAMPLGVVTLAIGAIDKWPTAWPFAVGVIIVAIAADALYIVLNKDLLKKGLESPRFTIGERDAELGEIIEADPNRVLVTVALVDGLSTRYLNDVPVTPEMQEFLTAFLKDPDNDTFAERTAKRFGGNALVADFQTLRDSLIKRMVLKWKNKKNTKSGYVWTALGKRAVRQLAQMEL